MAAFDLTGYIWITPQYSKSTYQITLGGVDERLNVLSSSFTRGTAPEIGEFEIVLDNNNGRYNKRYVGGETVELLYDFSDGTTRRFTGTLETPNDTFEDATGHQIKITGSHVTGLLADRTASASYSGSLSADQVITDLINRFAPAGFTANSLSFCPVYPTISFNGEPGLWDAICQVVALCKNFELYFDNDKDCHFSQQGTITNYDEAVVMGQTLKKLDGIGTNLLTVRNKIRVYGEAAGLPVIYTAQDLASQAANGIKVQIIKDKNVNTEDQAANLAEATLAVRRNKLAVGGGDSLMLPTLSPGDFCLISSPIQNILEGYRFIKYTHKLPEEETEFEVKDVVRL